MGRIGVMLPRDIAAGDLIGYVQQAEKLGFAEIWIVEDYGFHGGVAQAATTLAVTTSVTVGIGILPAAWRNAAVTAMELATLAEIHPGRLQAGLGHGMPDWMRQVGVWPASPLTLLEEHFRAIRDILVGRTVSTTGRYVRLDGVALDHPPAVVPPLLAGVRGPRSLALAGRVADGSILAEPVTPEYLAAVQEQVASSGDHLLVAYNVAAVDDDPIAARQVVRGGLQWIGEPDWSPHIAPLPYAEEFARLRAGCSSGVEFAQKIPDEWVDELSVTGTPAQGRSRIDQLFAAGATSVVLIPAGPEPLVALRSLARLL